MACKKSELAAAINSYAIARATGDSILIQSSANLVQALLDTLDYAKEEGQDEDADKGED